MSNINSDIVEDMQVVVLMGGDGNCQEGGRCPKVMADINGRPFFDYQLQLLKRWKFHKFLFLVDSQETEIEEYYKDGSGWQIDIQYSYSEFEQTGTGGALKNAEDKLEHDFLLVYGDSFVDINYQEMIYRYQTEKSSGKTGIMVIRKREKLCDEEKNSGNIVYTACGVYVLGENLFSDIEKNQKFDLTEFLVDLSETRKLSVHMVSKQVYGVRDSSSLLEFREYAHKRFDKKSPAVFFDRDGVINELVFNDEIEQIDSPFAEEDFEYKQGIIDILSFVQKMGYYIFVVTNQPAASKGKVSIAKLYDLNAWMVEDLKTKGITIEFVNICPHHPEGNQRAKAKFLIRKCNCRKPESGLITDLLQVYNIDLEQSYMVGDSYTDIIAGKKAGLKTVLVGELKCDACQRIQENRPDNIINEIKQLREIIGGEYV